MEEEGLSAKFRVGYRSVVECLPCLLRAFGPALESQRHTRAFKEVYLLENLQKEERKNTSWGWGGGEKKGQAKDD